MALVWLGSACGCVRWIGMPPLPPGSFNDTALYGVTKNKWGGNVNRARKLMRQPEAGFDWRLAGTAGESLARFSEVREKFAGVIFVGDSQIREVSWAALRMLTPAEQIRYDENDAVVGRKRASELGGSCVPQSVGKTGFTAECRAGVCRMHSPFHNKSHAEEMRKLLLTRPHDWDGSLSLTEAACRSDFFVSYQATWGAIPVKPLTLPRCMHPRTAADFEILYSELEAWRVKETEGAIAAAGDDQAARQRALQGLLQKETKLLQTIDRLKIAANQENRDRRIARELAEMGQPKTWEMADGTTVDVITPFTTRAQELQQLYHGLKLPLLSTDERLDVLLHIKWTVKEFDCSLTREIVDLIDREADLLNRGRSPKTLAGLRQRVANLFLQFCETPEFNPESAKFSLVPLGAEEATYA